jgi:hypothetical protein
MIRQTYGDIKVELARICGTTGMPVTDARLLIRTNEATQELMNEGQFAGVVDRWHITAVNGSIVLPPYLDMLLEFTAGGVPASIRSPWAEFVDYGPGPQEDLLPRGGLRRRWFNCSGGNLYDRGEVCTKTPIPVSDGTSAATIGPWVLRLYQTDVDSEAAGAYATIQGLDPNGLIVRSKVSGAYINGIQLGISSGSGYVESSQQFSDVTGFTKPSTNGYVKLTAWNGNTEVELSNYEPAETTPSYHKYFSPYLQAIRNVSNDCLKVVLCRARRRFVPIAEDTDFCIISNVVALKAMMIAQWKRDAGNLDVYAAMKLTAVDLMKKESVAYTGKVRAPALTFQRGFSIGELPAIR